MKNTDGNSLKKIGIRIGVVLIVILGLLLGYFSADLFSKFQDRNERARKEDIQPEVKNVSTSEMRLEDNATIFFNRVYTKCNEIATEKKAANASTIGKSKSELSDEFPEWTIADFTSDKLVLQKNIDSYSPDYYKLGTHDDDNGNTLVAVYTYDVEGREVLDRVTGTSLELIYASERQKLVDGIIVKGEDELYQLLENYDE